jgi:hypothetical protein
MVGGFLPKGRVDLAGADVGRVRIAGDDLPFSSNSRGSLFGSPQLSQEQALFRSG